jgi:hypothetical protein
MSLILATIDDGSAYIQYNMECFFYITVIPHSNEETSFFMIYEPSLVTIDDGSNYIRYNLEFLSTSIVILHRNEETSFYTILIITKSCDYR